MRQYSDEEVLEALEMSATEMAVVNPKLCNQLTIQVEVEQRDEGPTPHVHVYHDKTRNPKKCSYVRLDDASYCSFHGDAPKLPKELKKEFIQVMQSVYVRPVTSEKRTGYEMAVNIWVDTYEDDFSKFQLDKDNKPIMPDYSKL